MTSVRIRLYVTKTSLVWLLATLLLLLFTRHVSTWSLHQSLFSKTFFSCYASQFLSYSVFWRKHQKAVLPRIHLEEGLWHFRQVTQFILISVRRLLIQAYSSSFYRLTPDFIAERLGHANFSELRELDLPHCSLRTVDLGTKDVFINLRRLVSPRYPSSSPPHPAPSP